jgi:hypothetical protein
MGRTHRLQLLNTTRHSHYRLLSTVLLPHFPSFLLDGRFSSIEVVIERFLRVGEVLKDLNKAVVPRFKGDSVIRLFQDVFS